MNRSQAIREEHFERNFPLSVAFDSAGNYIAAANSTDRMAEHGCGSVQKTIDGLLLSVQGNVETPASNVQVEIHAVKPLKWVANTLPAAVLAHCRTLLLEAVKPIDIYRCAGHVADAPLVSFADVQQLRDIHGYELLAAAAKSQGDDYFRHLLGSDPDIARPLLCYYHPASFSTVRVAEATADAGGRFQCTVLEPRNADDKPGYVFIARHTISSNLYVTLYRPTPATWHTYWNWPADKIITLRTTHPLVRQQQKQA